MHAPDELCGIGVNGRVLLRFIQQEYPIDPDPRKLVNQELVREGDVKLVTLLDNHRKKNDGLTLELLKTLG